MNKIELVNVSYRYSVGTPFETLALDGVNVGFETGKITGVIGHTGSGKSTMMNLLNGLTKPNGGQILLDGEDIHINPSSFYQKHKTDFANCSERKAMKEIKALLKKREENLPFRVGLVMQYPEYQLFEETVYKDIAYGPSNMSLSEKEIDERVKRAGEFTGVSPEWFAKSPFDLSGGEKRRVALAGVIAMEPEVLVFDEPAAGLDPRGRNSVFDNIRRYQRETGTTVIVVSHSMEDMSRLCDNAVVLYHAKVLYQGSVREVFSHAEELTKSGLDLPQVTRVLQRLSEKGMPVRTDLYTVEEAVVELKRVLGVAL